VLGLFGADGRGRPGGQIPVVHEEGRGQDRLWGHELRRIPPVLVPGKERQDQKGTGKGTEQRVESGDLRGQGGRGDRQDARGEGSARDEHRPVRSRGLGRYTSPDPGINYIYYITKIKN